MILYDIIYLPKLQRNVLSLILIHQPGHSIHMFGGIMQIRRSFDNKVVMISGEDEKLLKLKGDATKLRYFAYLTHQEKGTLSYIILWHARFGHFNFDDLHLLKKRGFLGLPTIPRNIEPCEACVLGKHYKQSFPDSKFRACRKLKLIHSTFCGELPIPSTNGNKYIMTLIDDFTRMCWVYLLKNKSKCFEKLNKFHVIIEKEAHTHISTLHFDNRGEYT